MRTVGLIVNPVSGMGGAVGLKGTDGKETLVKAIELGARPVAIGRARTFLSGFRAVRTAVDFLTYPGEMGEHAFDGLGLRCRVLPGKQECTTGDDTKRAAVAMAREGAAAIAFCGGDGTARDVLDAVGHGTPVIGVPAGVKMQSGVFAVNPAAAAEIVIRFLWGELPLREGEVADVDEEAFRAGRLSSKLYGYLSVPYEPAAVQGMKSASRLTDESDDNRMAVAKWLVENMQDGVVYVLGPGTTVKAVNELLGIEGSLLGVDLVLDGKLLAKDVSEDDAIEALSGKAAKIVVSPIGKQGFIFGRGNQQISGRVLERAGRENVIVISTREKLNGIDALRVDTGNPVVDAAFEGGIKVLVDYNTFRIKKMAVRFGKEGTGWVAEIH